MAKKPSKLTEEDIKAMIDLEMGSKMTEVVEGVFKKLIEGVKGKIEGKITTLIYGGIIATILVLIALWWSNRAFINSYHQHFLDTQTTLNEVINTLRKENYDLQLQINNDIEDIKSKQDYLERFLMQRTTVIEKSTE